MNNQNFTTQNVFQQFPEAMAGHMLYDMIYMPPEMKPEFALMIKEEEYYIWKYDNKPKIEIRVGMMRIDNVVIIPLLLRFNNDPEMIYETVINYHRTDDIGKKTLDILSKQDTLTVNMFNESNIQRRAILIHNDIKEDIEEMNLRLKHIKPWSMSQFDNVKEKMYAYYPGVKILWDALEPIKRIE